MMAGRRFRANESRWDRQTWSILVGRVFGIDVWMHVTLIGVFLIALEKSYDPWLALLVFSLMFAIVLFHELGHCFACRAVGGTANRVTLWPLGGLAMCEPPPRPFESMVTTLGGPAVNFLLALVLIPILAVTGLLSGELFNPFSFLIEQRGFYLVLYAFFKLNWITLLFNTVLIFYPFDMGQFIQQYLWSIVGYTRSMILSTRLGMGGGAILAATGIFLAGKWSIDFFLLSGIGVFAFVQSWLIHREIEQTGGIVGNEFGHDFSQGYTSLEKSLPSREAPGFWKTIRDNVTKYRQSRKLRAEAELEAELDRILQKIKEQGMSSLTRREKRILTDASKKKSSHLS